MAAQMAYLTGCRLQQPLTQLAAYSQECSCVIQRLNKKIAEALACPPFG